MRRWSGNNASFAAFLCGWHVIVILEGWMRGGPRCWHAKVYVVIRNILCRIMPQTERIRRFTTILGNLSLSFGTPLRRVDLLSA
ncbi:hypothetical protein PhaeoP128_02336 [Phaeobacter gallaeciensis]|nr:hypothetical protein PhaeoP129_02336 [Phaeobacter gallaeciensis]ATF23067.1 hypothetical protein PhaeoP128_02336 [Phaeobacter gallaeciensis]